MKLQTNDFKVESNLESKASSFTINTENSAIFEILRNTLYSYPVQSMVRELLDNARDSHRAANKKDAPIKIWLGSYFTVQDFGVGISPDKINEIYCVYGNSTKRDTNELGGGFGIGSKTPFAVSDTFTVISCCDGKKSTYSAFIDESGIGKIQLVCQEDSNETGLTVKVPLKSSYLNEAILAAQNNCKYWFLTGDSKPTAIGFEITNVTVLARGDNFIYTSDSDSDVILNGLPYHYKSYNRLKVIANVGDFKLSANRESIQSTTKADTLYAKHMEEARTEYKEKIQEKIDSLPTFFEVCKYLNNFYENNVYEWKGKQFSYPLITWSSYRNQIQQKQNYRVSDVNDIHLFDALLKTDLDFFKQHQNKTLICKDDILDTSIPTKDAIKKIKKNGGQKRKEDILFYFDEDGNRKKIDINSVNEIIYMVRNVSSRGYNSQYSIDRELAKKEEMKVCQITENQLSKVESNPKFKHFRQYIENKYKKSPEYIRQIKSIHESYRDKLFTKQQLEEFKKYKAPEYIPSAKKIHSIDAIDIYYITSVKKEYQPILLDIVKEEIDKVCGFSGQTPKLP